MMIENIKTIEVSIVIVNYNSFDLLNKCIASLIEFTEKVSCEIIVIDNNSSIGNVDDVVSYFDEITLIKNIKNVGFGAANNQGLKIAKGKYVLFLNNDTILLENTIKKVFDFAESLNDNLIIVETTPDE